MKTLAVVPSVGWKDERKIHEKQATDDVKSEKERKWEEEPEESFMQHPSADPEAVNPESGASWGPERIQVHMSQTWTSAQFMHRF